MDQALQTLTARREFMRAEFSGDAGPAGSQDRTGHQPANRKGARSDHTAPTAWSRRRGDRIKARVIRLIFKPVKWALFALEVSGKSCPRHFGFILRSRFHSITSSARASSMAGISR